MSSGTYKHDQTSLSRIIKFIDQQKIAAYVALAMTRPLARQSMI